MPIPVEDSPKAGYKGQYKILENKTRYRSADGKYGVPCPEKE